MTRTNDDHVNGITKRLYGTDFSEHAAMIKRAEERWIASSDAYVAIGQQVNVFDHTKTERRVEFRADKDISTTELLNKARNEFLESTNCISEFERVEKVSE